MHGPIQAFATVGGQKVAIAEARSTYGHEIDSVVAYKRLNSGEVTSPQHVPAGVRARELRLQPLLRRQAPRRLHHRRLVPAAREGHRPEPARVGHRRVGLARPALLRELPKQIDPKRGYFTNWNNKQAPGWRSADDNWAFGSLQRVQRLQKRVRKGIKGRRKLTLDRADEGDAGRRHRRPARAGLLPAAAQGDRQAPGGLGRASRCGCSTRGRRRAATAATSTATASTSTPPRSR